jgi:hypothetical protein
MKGDDLYQVNIVPNEPMRWKYSGKVDPKRYQTQGVLVQKPSLKLISIMQRDLQPKNESKFESFKSWLNEEQDREYLAWKRNNVTLRGMKEIGMENGVYGSFGKGLYSVPLSNKAMAKQYGELYYLVNAKPKNPKIVSGLNEAEIWVQNLIFKFCKKNGIERYDKRFFEANTSIEKEMLDLGYDGLIIRGREMVNYIPDDVKYFQTENHLYDYYQRLR